MFSGVEAYIYIIYQFISCYTGMARWREAPSAATRRVAAECPPIGNT